MPDFPRSGTIAPKIGISSVAPICNPHWDFHDIINVVSGAAVWPAANLALFLAFHLEFSVLAQKMGVQVTTQNGNLDVGIYDQKGNRIVSKGSTAVGAAGLQVIDITDTVLGPGTYFMAMACSSGTAAFTRTTIGTAFSAIGGIQQMATAFALPDPATFANPTQGYFPCMVIQCASVL